LLDSNLFENYGGANMTYYGAKELAESFKTVRKNTIQVAQDIPEDKYGFAAAEGTRSVEKLLTHIAISSRFPIEFHDNNRTNFEGIDFQSFFAKIMEDEAKPRTKNEVISLLQETGEVWAGFLDKMTEESLAAQITLPPGAVPQIKSRFEMILSVKEHEMHHRAQLMAIERMLGIVPHLTRDMQARFAQAQQQAAKS
jgi:uncharacterized damage-inducible protein DinB